MSDASITVLVVDDDLTARLRLAAYLRKEGYRVDQAGDGHEMWQALAREPAALILLDINLPGQDGISLARELRARDPGIGIILVTSRDEDIDRIVGLEVGADDYVTKPFNPRVLLARAKTLLRRAAVSAPAPAAGPLRLGVWRLDPSARCLLPDSGAEVPLTRGEFVVLQMLAASPDAVVSRDQLSRAVSGRDWSPNDRTIDVLVRRLRAKLDAADAVASLITTVRGEGYRLSVDARGVNPAVGA